MLTEVNVKNLALIREASVSFKNGLNILTGETGAGKSIIIDSIALTLGAKASADMIRQGAEYALTELEFVIEDEDLRQRIKDMDMPVEEDGTIILSRKLKDSRSSFKVCGESVSAKQMKELASLLIDIHGQHEHQSLLKKERQRELLDAYCGKEMEDMLGSAAVKYSELKEIEEKMKALDMDDTARKRELSLAEYEVNEIEAANIRSGEEDELEERFKRMKNSENIFEALGKVKELLSSDDGIIEAAGRAVREMDSAANFDERLKDTGAELSGAEDILRSVSRQIDDYIEDSEFDGEEYRQTEERLDVLNRLMAKYGNSGEKILEYLEKRKKELEELGDAEKLLSDLGKEKEKKEEELGKINSKIHDLRVKTAGSLQKDITETLMDLNFLKVSFKIDVSDTGVFSAHGSDEVQFLISLNPGEKEKPLSDVASGGELSRIMLALKSVFARKDAIGTLIFDEIDTGISGKTAWKVSEKMAAIAKDHQVICITHLPQIAAMADTHFCIEKSESAGRTETEISALDGEGSLNELARMLGGDSVSDMALANASELKNEAGRAKKTIRA
ncbi:MAG: DNA repair protein RecN [Lachnospiraceae bacterium]|nr:DNA repair protein RecN [Lachnospiraceae bacterium]